MFFKKKEIELNDTGRALAITLGTIFGVGVGTATTYSMYRMGSTVMPDKKQKTVEPDEEDDD